eukprot:GILJ01008711.1.p1 GENE.GILJ01008711.1~~GILJ01008711.1.p1  ORF type:complete len:992 (-),score=162.32 GILJ01008711.1:118-3093(-)
MESIELDTAFSTRVKECERRRELLMKKGRRFGRLVSRWCQLVDGKLHYYDAQHDLQPKGVYDLQGVTGVSSISSPVAKLPYCLEIAMRISASSSPKCFYLFPSTREDLQAVLIYIRMAATGDLGRLHVHHTPDTPPPTNPADLITESIHSEPAQVPVEDPIPPLHSLSPATVQTVQTIHPVRTVEERSVHGISLASYGGDFPTAIPSPYGGNPAHEGIDSAAHPLRPLAATHRTHKYYTNIVSSSDRLSIHSDTSETPALFAFPNTDHLPTVRTTTAASPLTIPEQVAVTVVNPESTVEPHVNKRSGSLLNSPPPTPSNAAQTTSAKGRESIADSSSGSPPSCNESLRNGLEALWKTDFEAAERSFGVFRHTSLRHALHYAETSFFRILVSGLQSEVDRCVVRLSDADQVVARARQTLSSKKGSVMNWFKVDSTSSDSTSASGDTDRPIEEDIFTYPWLIDLISAEINLCRSTLFVLVGNKLRAFIFMRDSWKLYKKVLAVYTNERGTLFNRLNAEEEEDSASQSQTRSTQHKSKKSVKKPRRRSGSNADQSSSGFDRIDSLDSDIRSRLKFGVGLFCLGLSIVSSSLSTILKLAGFVTSKAKGILFLTECANENGIRSSLAALILVLYYLDIEVDIVRAEELLDDKIRLFPDCVLFHWAASIMAWKNCNIDDAIFLMRRALFSCGSQLSSQAVFLRYELGWFYFLKMEWAQGLQYLEQVLYSCFPLGNIDGTDFMIWQPESTPTVAIANGKSNKSTKLETVKSGVHLPHRACLTMQLAACCFVLNQSEKGELYLKATQMIANQPSHTRSSMDEEFGRLAVVFHRRKQKRLLPYEVLYFLKQMPRLPDEFLWKTFQRLSAVVNGLIQERSKVGGSTTATNVEQTMELSIDLASGFMLQIMIYCLIGETRKAFNLIQDARSELNSLPTYCQYLIPHTLYWCGRAALEEGQVTVAIQYLKTAAKYKKYEFDISAKISRVLRDAEKGAAVNAAF